MRILIIEDEYPLADAISETLKKETIIEIIIIIVLTAILGVVIYSIVNLKSNNNGNSQMEQMGKSGEMGQMGQSSTSAETSRKTEVTETKTLTGEYETSTKDESAIKTSDGGNLTLENATITKTGDSTNTENSEFYGVNAGVLTTSNSTTTIKNSTITTNAKGANAVFATGENTKVYVYDTTIKTTGESSSRGLDSTYGGYIEADNVTISTEGGSCATLATDRGEGTVIAKNSVLSTKGAGSPVIYSTGDISIENTKGTATGAQMAVIEGKNIAKVTNSTLSCSGKGNRNNADNCGIMIYQSMSWDAGEGTGTFTSKNSTLEITSDSSYYTSAPFFFVTNTKAVINLEQNTLKYGSGVLLKVAATSQWGKTGSNGGKVTFNMTNQEAKGNIEVDNISTLEMNLKQGSKLETTINSANTAKSITLNIDRTSTLTLTGDCYVTSLTDEDTSYSNINFNGYKLYVNGTAVN